MKKTYLFSILLLGLAMTILGFFILFNPSTSLMTATLIIGSLLILNGVNEIIGYFQQARVWNISYWHLIEGIFSLVIGVTTFFYTDIAQQLFVFIFAIWILLSAVSHIFISRTLKGLPGANLLLGLGVIMFVFAILSFFTQLIAAITLSIIIGLFFIAQGLIWIALWLVIRKLKLN